MLLMQIYREEDGSIQIDETSGLQGSMQDVCREDTSVMKTMSLRGARDSASESNSLEARLCINQPQNRRNKLPPAEERAASESIGDGNLARISLSRKHVVIGALEPRASFERSEFVFL